MSYKVGIGLCTYNRPIIASRVALATRETTDNVNLVCSIDGGDIDSYDLPGLTRCCDEIIIGENKGVVQNKNRLLVYLQNCDYIFIVEDDIVPLKKGWVELYINALNNSGYGHLNYIHDLAKTHKVKDMEFQGTILDYYEDLGGALMLMSKKCIDKVGLLDPGYNFYGYGHCDYTRRCEMAGEYPPINEGHPHIRGIDSYITLDMSLLSVTTESDKEMYLRKNGERYNSGSPQVNVPITDFLKEINIE